MSLPEPAYEKESWDIPIEEFKWRIMRTVQRDEGVMAYYAAYPDARTVSSHLDRLFGPGGWTDDYVISPSGKSVVCVLKVRMGDEWISKSDVGNVTDIEPMKGGFSDAFKRAAAKLGVGRNAYDIPELWGPVSSKGDRHYKPFTTRDGRPFDEWLVEQAYKALRGEAKSDEVKPQSSDPNPSEDSASAPASSAKPENEAWTRFMETMKALSDDAKERVKNWWLENGDDSSRPTADTDPELLKKVGNFATSVLMESELGAEPF